MEIQTKESNLYYNSLMYAFFRADKYNNIHPFETLIYSNHHKHCLSHLKRLYKPKLQITKYINARQRGHQLNIKACHSCVTSKIYNDTAIDNFREICLITKFSTVYKHHAYLNTVTLHNIFEQPLRKRLILLIQTYAGLAPVIHKIQKKENSENSTENNTIETNRLKVQNFNCVEKQIFKKKIIKICELIEQFKFTTYHALSQNKK